jgi:hypothetical protein
MGNLAPSAQDYGVADRGLSPPSRGPGQSPGVRVNVVDCTDQAPFPLRSGIGREGLAGSTYPGCVTMSVSIWWSLAGCGSARAARAFRG